MSRMEGWPGQILVENHKNEFAVLRPTQICNVLDISWIFDDPDLLNRSLVCYDEYCQAQLEMKLQIFPVQYTAIKI